MQNCSTIWDVVAKILCIDSPEGHSVVAEEELDIGVKDTLSFSWRTLKEARFEVSPSYNSYN